MERQPRHKERRRGNGKCPLSQSPNFSRGQNSRPVPSRKLFLAMDTVHARNDAQHEYIDKVAATAVAKKSVVSDVSTASEGKLIKELSQLADEISTGLETLKADTAKALATEDPLANAKAYQTVVLSDMDELRKSVDAAETLIPDALLPYPTYDKLLFSV